MLDDDDLTRYARQVILPEFGEDSQLQLMASKVAVIGAGGLGAPLLQYLAAAGIGTITVIDDDAVELSNLNRQVIHRSDSIGTPKAESARAEALAINPRITVNTINARLTAETADDLIGDAAIIADCSDTAATRYAVAAAAHRLGRVMVFGGAVRLEGQIASFDSGRDPNSPCFACIFPQSPGHDLAPRCSEAGILGPITGVIGTLMALEVIRQCLKPARPISDDLIGQLLLFDGRFSELRSIAVSRRPDCPVCGG